MIRGDIADLRLLRTLLAIRQKSREPSLLEVIDSFVLLLACFIISTPLQWLLACLNFRFRRFILLIQTKKVISMNYGSSTSSWKPRRWVRLDLILTMSDVYISSNLNPLTKFTSSSRSTELKGFFSWNISQMITKTVLWNISQMIMKTVPISTRIVISYTMKWGIPFWVDGKSMETETITSKFPNGGKAVVKQILALKDRNKSKRARLRVTVRDPSKNVNYLSRVIWEKL